MRIFAIDPGDKESGWCIWDTSSPHLLWEGRQWKSKLSGKVVCCDLGIPPFGIVENTELLSLITQFVERSASSSEPRAWVIEGFTGYGKAVGREVFDACRWSGRFEQHIISIAGADELKLIPRAHVKLALTAQRNTKDSDVRAALIQRYGSVGVKEAPGTLYGVTQDVWSAVALAVAMEMKLGEQGKLPIR